MDLDEWELLPNNGGFNFDLHENGEKFRNSQLPSSTNPNCFIDMDYFKNFTQNSKICTSRVVLEIGEIPVEENNKILEDQSSSQLFFKNELVDMKLDSPRPQIVAGNHQFEEKEEEEEDNDGGLNVWKWAVNGFGAVFSIGLVAVTVSLIVLGKSRHKQYSHDKRMKQMLKHATKLNEVINEVIGAPMARADITIGGSYYEEAL